MDGGKIDGKCLNASQDVFGVGDGYGHIFEMRHRGRGGHGDEFMRIGRVFSSINPIENSFHLDHFFT